MKYELDINKVNLINLGGVDLKKGCEETFGMTFEKLIGNIVYENTRDIGVAEIARKIYSGEPAMMDERERKLFEEALKDKLTPVMIEREIIANIMKIE